MNHLANSTWSALAALALCGPGCRSDSAADVGAARVAVAPAPRPAIAKESPGASAVAGPAPAAAAAAEPVPIPAGVLCERFVVSASVQGDELAVTVDTDLPADARLEFWLTRSYWEKGDTEERAFDYADAVRTVVECSPSCRFPLDNAAAVAKLVEARDLQAKTGLGGEMDRISPELSLTVWLDDEQSNPAFGELNRNLKGACVTDAGEGAVEVEKELEVAYPLDVPVPESRYVSSESLVVKGMYVVSRRTPVVPEIHPRDPVGAMRRAYYIEDGGRFRVSAVQRVRHNNWYEVTAFDERGKRLGSGWINGIALIGQDIVKYSK